MKRGFIRGVDTRVGNYVLVYLGLREEVVRVTHVYTEMGACVFACVTAEGTTYPAVHGGFVRPLATSDEVLEFAVKEALREEAV